jgi:hydrogenase maturation protease
MAKSMGALLQRILLVGCEPVTLGPEEGQMGLSEVVENAVERAVTLTESLVTKILNDEWPLVGDQREENLRKDR